MFCPYLTKVVLVLPNNAKLAIKKITWLEGEQIIRTTDTFFETIKWWFSSIAVLGAFQARN